MIYRLDFIFTLVVSFLILFIGILSVIHDYKSTTNRLFFSISLITVFWSIVNYFSINGDASVIIFWARLVIFFGVAHAALFFLFILNFPNRDFVAKTWFLVPFAIFVGATMILTQTSLIFKEVVFSGVSFLPKAGPLILLLGVAVVAPLLASSYVLIHKYRIAKDKERKSWGMMIMGFFTSYAIVIMTNFILVNYYNNTSFIPLAPAFMLPFIIGMAYSILKFRLMNIKTIATEILVFTMLSISLVQIFLSKSTGELIFKIVSFCLFLFFSGLLIRSVMKEVEQRERLEILTGKLEDVNESLKELIKQRESLVHLVTHKVKGSFTRTKYIFAGILDGTFGDISPEIKKIAEQGLEFDNSGIQTVDLVLNVANIQNGLIKYDMQTLDFKELVEQSISNKKIQAEAKGLKLETEIKPDAYNILGDSIWLKEAINNLIDNSIKYTKKGEITVGLEKRDDKILFSVKDTGIGITEEDKKNLFTEGGRGKDSIKINVDSTGYGLFTVKLIVEAHKGKIWYETEVGKGSTFFVELPVDFTSVVSETPPYA